MGPQGLHRTALNSVFPAYWISAEIIESVTLLRALNICPFGCVDLHFVAIVDEKRRVLRARNLPVCDDMVPMIPVVPSVLMPKSCQNFRFPNGLREQRPERQSKAGH